VRRAQDEHAARDGWVRHRDLGAWGHPGGGGGSRPEGRARLELKGDGLAGAVRQQQLQQARVRGVLVPFETMRVIGNESV
jgi:hypothetical protein